MTPLLQAWEHTCAVATESFVLPDGCQDLIGIQLPNAQPFWFVATLSDRVYKVNSQAGLRYVGYRFAPGANFDEAKLLKHMAQTELDDKASSLIAIDNCVRTDPRITEVLGALAYEPNIKMARHQLGISERTLQRSLNNATGRTAIYWKRLARWRQAALKIANDTETPLVQVAAEYGYFDQAHMNLEFRHWLGVTPRDFQNNPTFCRLVNDSGFGT